MAKTVCIIGAGPSGLVAAKTLLHNVPDEGAFRVSVFDSQRDIGGLWPSSRADSGRQVHPLMVANQSKHTMHFSDQTWDDDDPQFPLAWMVGRYLRRYMDRYLTGHPGFDLKLGTRVVSATPREGGLQGWDVVVQANGVEETRVFDQVLAASGFFGKPIIPASLQGPCDVPVIHSSAYRDLEGLLGKGRPGGGKILVVGGQMSGVEIAGTIATHLSSAANSPEESEVRDVGKYSIHHVVQRPVWVFPLFTSPEPKSTAAPFLPFDFASYNLNNRQHPLVDTQGHISEETAKTVHGAFQNVLGTDQSIFSRHLRVTDKDKAKQPYIAVSDWYCEFVRSGLITLSTGKVDSINGTTATISPGGNKVEDIAAVVVATGFDASPCLEFLPEDVLRKLNHSPRHIDQPVALAFHGTHHPDVPGLGFVGFYRSPYWGVMQMQARFLARYWSQSGENGGSSKLSQKLAQDVSIQRTLDLRVDPRCSQFPMGDYPFLMQDMAEALGMSIKEPLTEGLPNLSRNGQPLNMLTPARYPDSNEAGDDSQRLREETRSVALAGLTTPRFVARAVFRSLLGTWKLERDLVSKLPSHPTGHFSGTGQFVLRRQTGDGLQCAADGTPATAPHEDDEAWEYLYIEEGEFKTDGGFGFKATRRYIWRYDERRDVLSVWFVKPDDATRADYLFHEVKFEMPDEGRGQLQRSEGWPAKAGHLCIDDFYDVEYNFAFQAVNLREWSVGYTVKGPKKDYTIRGTYTR